MRQLDILFIHPNASKKIYQGLSENHSAIETPIWAGMLANHCRTKGFGVQILDCEAELLSSGEATKIIIDINPRLICMVVYGQQPNASSQNMEGAIDLSEKIKEFDSSKKILFVGGHVSALPYHVLENEPSVDMVCQNEGVYTISNLLQISNFDDETELKKVNGLGFRTKDFRIILNDLEDLVSKENLEHDLPGIAWDLLPDVSKYRTSGWHSWMNNTEKTPFASLYTSLGCPYQCSFCMINIINRKPLNSNQKLSGLNVLNTSASDYNSFRWWNPDFMIKEFDKLALMGVKNIKIADEMFVLNPNHFMKISQLLADRDYGFNIWAYCRIDTCKPKYLDTLQKAGVRLLGLGIENPNQMLRKEVVKGGFEEVKIKDIIKMIHEAGIEVGSNYLFGLPYDTVDSMQETLDFALENTTANVNMCSAMAYPGSPLYHEAKARGWKLPDRYAGYSQHSYYTQNLPTNNISASEVLAFRDKAWMAVHTSPKFLKLLKDKFGQRAVDDVKSTTKIKLKRRLLGE